MNLRRTMAEAGLDYEATEAAVKAGHIRSKLEASSAPAEDIEEIVKLVEDHFKLGRNKYFFVDVSHFFPFLLNKITMNYKHILILGKQETTKILNRYYALLQVTINLILSL